MIIFVDIDGVICNNTDGKYEKAKPKIRAITKINKLVDEGHTVVYWTARGATTGKDWTEFTKQQLDKWGCKYTEIRMGKPYYDVFIDDKAVTL